MTAYVLAEGYEHHFEELSEWAVANGLNPALIPDSTPIEVDGDRLTVHEVIPDPDGDGIIAAQYVDNKPVTRPRTVPLVKAPDPALWVKQV